jgi:hypothetical protein
MLARIFSIMKTIMVCTKATEEKKLKTNYCEGRVIPLKFVVIEEVLAPRKNVYYYDWFELPAHKSWSDCIN